jgi:hypothetical protein
LEYFVSGNPAENLGLRLRAKKERVHLWRDEKRGGEVF